MESYTLYLWSSLFQHKYFEMHPHCCTYQYPFYCWVALYCMVGTSLFIHSLVNGHLGSFQICAAANKAAMNIHVQVSRTTGWCNRYMFNFLRNCQTVFQSGRAILHSHQPGITVPSSSTFRPILVLVSLFHFIHSIGCVVVPDWFYVGLWEGGMVREQRSSMPLPTYWALCMSSGTFDWWFISFDIIYNKPVT